MIGKIPPVPDPGAEDEGSEVEEETVPIPYEIERIEHVVEHRHGDERLIYFSLRWVQKM